MVFQTVIRIKLLDIVHFELNLNKGDVVWSLNKSDVIWTLGN